MNDDEAESFEERITRFNIEFTAALMQLLDQINDLNRDTSDHDRLFNLLYRYVIFNMMDVYLIATSECRPFAVTWNTEKFPVP